MSYSNGRRWRERNLAGCGESPTPKPAAMKTINPRPRMTWISPISWGGKLLRLLHITSSNKTVQHHDPIPHLPFVAPRTDFSAVDDRPSALANLPYDIILPAVVPRTDFDDLPISDLAHLPRDIILDILSRLPPECIFECQCVSRPLQVLTTTPFFTRMHRQRSTPVMVVQLSSEIAKLYYMDKKLERIEEIFTRSSSVGSSLYTKPPETTCDPIVLFSSYDGFLTFSNLIGLPKKFYMWNPITGEQLTIEDKNMHVCGLFFNPVRKDHELLYYATDGELAPFRPYYNFGVHNLRTKLRRYVGRFPYPPYRHRPPVIIKGTLYWMIDRRSDMAFSANRVFCPPFSVSIMSFNIETEKFKTLEPGGRKFSTTEPREDYRIEVYRISRLHLSEMDEELCLCDFITFNQLLLSIFNHATQCWSTRTIVILPEYPGHFSFDRPNTFASEVVQIKDNELLVRQGRRLLLYNMLSHACKISEIMGSMDKGIRVTVHTYSITSFHLWQ